MKISSRCPHTPRATQPIGRLASSLLVALMVLGVSTSARAEQIVATATGTVYAGALDQSNTNLGVFGPPGSLAGRKFTLVFTLDDTKGTQKYLPDSNGTGLIQQSTLTGSGATSPGTATLTIGGTTVSFGDGSISPGNTAGATQVARYVDGVLTTQINFMVQDNNSGKGVDHSSSTDIQMSIYKVATNDGDWRTTVPNVAPGVPNYLGYFSYSQYRTTGPSTTFAVASGSLQIENVTLQGLAYSPLSRRICFGGKDVTKTTANVVVGQPIQLTAGTSGSPCQAATNLTQSWVVCGGQLSCTNTIAGYTPTAVSHPTAIVYPVSSISSIQPSMGPFYWTAQGAQTVTYHYQLPDGTNAAATTTFRAAGPPAVSAEQELGELWLQPGILHPPPPGVGGPPRRGTWFSLLDAPPNSNCKSPSDSAGNTAGMTLCGKITQGQAPAPAGEFFWVQLFSDIITITPEAGSPTTYAASGLDTCYPYTYDLAMDDSPEDEIRQGTAKYERQFNARDYLMWKADPTSVPNSIAVPLGSAGWGFDGVVTLMPSGDWTVSSSSVTHTGYAAGTDYPLWTGVGVGAWSPDQCDRPPPGETAP